MNDLIDRQAAIDALGCVGYDFSESGLSEPELEEVCEAVGEVKQDMIMRIRHLPSAQPDIIRCKDCKHADQYNHCDRVTFWNSETDYCSKAEKRGLKMADIMTFPDTVEEFMEKYKIIDTERIYTNGTEMIPISRMRQWFDHESAKRTSKKAQNVLNSDLISRKEAIDALCSRCAIDKPETCSTIQKGDGWCDEVYTILNLPSAQPEITLEQAIERLHELGWMQEHDRILTESAQPEPNFDEWCTDCKEYDQERHCCPRWNRVIRNTLRDIQSEQRWIPCSERLPEKNGRYLVTRGLNAAGTIWNRVYIVNYSDLMGLKDRRIFWQGNVGKSDFEKLEDVLSWLPLPEPWKEGEEGGE